LPPSRSLFPILYFAMVSAILALAALPLLTAAHAPVWPRKPLLRHDQVREGGVSIDYGLEKRQDGGVTPNQGGTFTYNCDASKCKLPNCACASTNIPGGIAKVRFRFGFWSVAISC
jgi:hypothetical protein